MRFTLLAIVLMIGLLAGIWVVERYISPPVQTGLFVRDRAGLDQRGLCDADALTADMLRLGPGQVMFAGQACDIVFHRDEALPMEGDGSLPFTTIGYRCADAAPGPDETSGELVLMSGRLQMTSYREAGYDLRGYVPAHANFLSCAEVLAP